MTTVSALLNKIEAFCASAEIAESTFGFRAVRDGKFVKRLRDGAGVTISTVERVESYIAAQRAEMKAPKRTRRAA